MVAGSRWECWARRRASRDLCRPEIRERDYFNQQSKPERKPKQFYIGIYKYKHEYFVIY